MKDFKELLIKNRSYRRYYEDTPMQMEILEDAIENVRYSPSAANLQPIRFYLINEIKTNERIFPNLKWAAYLKDWDGPEPGERPTAYIVMVADRTNNPFVDWDKGIALQTILLTLAAKGFGGCAHAAFNKDGIRQVLNVPDNYETLAVIAIGKPKEKVVLDDVKDRDIKYWREPDGTHHVPKRTIDELILKKIGE